MSKILKKLKSKEFYKKNWHRLLLAPILFFGILISSYLYILSGGFFIIFYLSLLLGFIFSILFVIKYDKKHFFVLIFIVLLQVITVNIDYGSHEIYDGVRIIGKNQVGYDEYYKVHGTCFGIKRSSGETRKNCVGMITNCFVETFRQEDDQLLSKEIFSCTDYNKIWREKKDIKLQYLKERRENEEKEAILQNEDVILFEKSAAWGPCPPDSICHQSTKLYYSGTLIVEGATELQKQLNQEEIDNLIEKIKSTDIMNKDCSAPIVLDYSATYKLNINDQERTIKFPDCEDELKEIENLILDESSLQQSYQ